MAHFPDPDAEVPSAPRAAPGAVTASERKKCCSPAAVPTDTWTQAQRKTQLSAVSRQLPCNQHVFSPLENLGCGRGDSPSHILEDSTDKNLSGLSQVRVEPTDKSGKQPSGRQYGSKADEVPGRSTSGRECAKALGCRHTRGEAAQASVAGTEEARGRGGEQLCRPCQLGSAARPAGSI